MISCNPCCANWRADRLIVMCSGSNPWLRQARPAAHAVRNTQAPMSTMSPVSSAIGMKSAGGTMPARLFQRTSASTPTMRPLLTSTVGW